METPFYNYEPLSGLGGGSFESPGRLFRGTPDGSGQQHDEERHADAEPESADRSDAQSCGCAVPGSQVQVRHAWLGATRRPSHVTGPTST